MQNEIEIVNTPATGISQSDKLTESKMKRFQARNHIIYCWLRAALRYVFLSTEIKDRWGVSIKNRDWRPSYEAIGAWLSIPVVLLIMSPFAAMIWLATTSPLSLLILLAVALVCISGGIVIWGVCKIVPKMIEFLTGQKEP